MDKLLAVCLPYAVVAAEWAVRRNEAVGRAALPAVTRLKVQRGVARCARARGLCMVNIFSRP